MRSQVPVQSTHYIHCRRASKRLAASECQFTMSPLLIGGDTGSGSGKRRQQLNRCYPQQESLRECRPLSPTHRPECFVLSPHVICVPLFSSFLGYIMEFFIYTSAFAVRHHGVSIKYKLITCHIRAVPKLICRAPRQTHPALILAWSSRHSRGTHM